MQHIAQRFDVDAARAQHNHRAKLRVIDHAEQKLDTAGRDHRRQQCARTQAPRKVTICAQQRGFVAQVEPNAVELGLVIGAASCGFQYHRIAEFTRRLARLDFALDDAAGIRWQLQVAQR
jgi:hypothetical protein